MREAGDFDFLSVLSRSWQIWRRAPHVHLLVGLVLPLGSIVSFGALLGPISVGYFRYLRALSQDRAPETAILFSGFDGDMGLSMKTGLALLWGTIAGLLVGVLPGLLFLMVFGFAVRSVADGATSVRAAMRASLELFKYRTVIVSELWGMALALQIVGLASVVLAPLTSGVVAVVLSEGRERLFL
ncbi:MAG: hypothetical protein IT381_23220 [Deltaproteobacteria bacterium]|nr:hypothetical protein [Deltaproteobacteria bacterium]